MTPAEISKRVSGTVVFSYYWCPRQAWLMYRNILPEQDNLKLSSGRVLHELAKRSRGKKEFVMEGMKVDRVEKHGDVLYIYEVKHSLRSYRGARLQMLYYLYRLKLEDIVAIGKLEFPKSKETYTIKLTSSNEMEIESFLSKMWEDLTRDKPPPITKRRCKYCGYRNICHA